MDNQSDYSDLEQQLGGTKEEESEDIGTSKTSDVGTKTDEDDNGDDDGDGDSNVSDGDEDDDDDDDFGILGVATGIRKPIVRMEQANPYATKYELTAAIAKRAQQLAHGAQPTVNVDGLINVNDIASKELRERMIPLIIERPFPDGTIIRVRVKDLIYPVGFL